MNVDNTQPDTSVYHTKQKYFKLYLSLKRDIESGVYRSSEKLPTEIELTQRYEVSRPTVAKALELLRKSGYIERISGVGTFVRYEPSPHVKRFALLIPGLGETEIFEPICGHMSHLAQLKNFTLIWSGTMQADAEMRRQHIKQLAQSYIEQQSVDGVFFAPLELTSEKDTVNLDIVHLFDRAGIPVVLMDRDVVSFPSRSSYDIVGVDNFRLAFILTQHLLERGCTTVKFAARPYSAPTVQMRIFGYQQALTEAGIPRSAQGVHIGDVEERCFVERLLADAERLGILCANDTTASKLMHALEERGYKIPADVKVAGVDDIKYAKYLRVPLTTYKQPCQEIAAAAIDLMFSRIQQPAQKARSVLLDGELIVRKSTL
jgi:DNA-binding LacI/PurR family transcriptional regulator